MPTHVSTDQALLKLFIRGLTEFMGRGGARAVGKSIGMQESAFSRLLNDSQRHFDRKTLLAYALMQQTRSEAIPDAEQVDQAELGPMVFKAWKKQDGEIAYTWSAKEEHGTP